LCAGDLKVIGRSCLQSCFGKCITVYFEYLAAAQANKVGVLRLVSEFVVVVIVVQVELVYHASLFEDG
jgi:hypothetical protein